MQSILWRLLAVGLLAIGLAGCALTQERTFGQAVERFRAHDYAGAEQLAARTAAAAPGTPKHKALLGWARLMQGNLDGARAVRDELLRSDPDYIETTQLDAWVAQAEGRTDHAAERFARILQWAELHRSKDYYPYQYLQTDVDFIESVHADGNYGLALIALARKDSRTALARLDEAAKVGQYGSRGDVLALRAELVRRDCDSGRKAAWTRYYAGEAPDAVEGFAELQARGCPGPAELAVGEGAALYALGRIDEAEDRFSRAIRIDPAYARAQAGRAAIAYARGDYRTAVRLYSATLDRLPAAERLWDWGSHALNNLGWSQYWLKDYAGAEGTFMRLLSYHQPSEYAAAHSGLGWVSLRTRRSQEARRHFTRALELAPGDPIATAGLKELGG